MTETTERSERVDLRMTSAAKRTLQRAAAVTNKTLTEFLLDSGLNAAFDTLADRRVFQLDEKRWDAFMAGCCASEEQSQAAQAACPQARMGKVTGQTTGTALTAPAPLAPHHELEGSESGVAALDDWLKRRARRNEAEGASRTFVVCAGRRVVGYYSLAAGSILHVEATGKVRRNMPDPVPALLLGRLAVDRTWHGKGLGGDLLQRCSVAGGRRGRDGRRSRPSRACDVRAGESILRKARLSAVPDRTFHSHDYNSRSEDNAELI